MKKMRFYVRASRIIINYMLYAILTWFLLASCVVVAYFDCNIENEFLISLAFICVGIALVWAILWFVCVAISNRRRGNDDV